MLQRKVKEMLLISATLKKEDDVFIILSILLNLKLQIHSLIQTCYSLRSSFSKKMPQVLKCYIEKYLLANDQISMKEVCRNWSSWTYKPNLFSSLTSPEHIIFENDVRCFYNPSILPMPIHVTQKGNLLIFNRSENYIDITSQITQNIENLILVNRWYFSREQMNLFKFIGTKSGQNDFECITYFSTAEVPIELIELILPTPIQQSEAYQDHPYMGNKREFCIVRNQKLFVQQTYLITKCKRKFIYRNESPAIISETFNINLFESRTFYKTQCSSEAPSTSHESIQGLFYQQAFDVLHCLKWTDKYLIGYGSVKDRKMLVIWSKETYQIQKVRTFHSLWNVIRGQNFWTVNDYLLFVYDFDESKIKVYDLFQNKTIQVPKHFKFNNKKTFKNYLRGMVATNEFLFLLFDRLHRFRLNYL